MWLHQLSPASTSLQSRLVVDHGHSTTDLIATVVRQDFLELNPDKPVPGLPDELGPFLSALVERQPGFRGPRHCPETLASSRLPQLEAFTISTDHARQEAVWASLSWNKDAHTIRRGLTGAAVSARDRRMQFVGLDTYEAAGGEVARDLFSEAGECWVEDAALLDRMASAKLGEVAYDVGQEGWFWVDAAIDMPFGHGFRRAYPEPVELAPEDEARRFEASEELERLTQEHPDDGPEEVVALITALEAEITALEARSHAYPADVIARAGAFVSIGHDGRPRIERGFVRPEHEGGASDATRPTDDGIVKLSRRERSSGRSRLLQAASVAARHWS